MPDDPNHPLAPVLRSLRDAIRHSPDNAPLRESLAECLLGAGLAADADRELREALQRFPSHPGLMTLAARAALALGTSSKALVILEDLIKTSATPARRILLARALLATGDRDRASYQYRQAIDAEPSAADSTLAAELDLPSRSSASSRDEDDDRLAMGLQGEIISKHSASSAEHTPLERPSITFKDVGGMDAVKDDIRIKIIEPLRNPALYKAYGKSAGGGILLYGPPGCGKTFLARATAGEVSARFLAIGIADVLNMYIGQSEKNLRDLFQQARDNTPCVLFFDEVDALGASRSDMRHSAGRHLVNQFLSELDGVGASNEGVLILAATNAPWHIDAAFRRPGRFDRIIFIPPPDAPARAQIIRLLLAGKPQDNVDADAIARKTDHFSGADLKAVVDAAIEAKLRESLSASRSGAAPTPAPLRTKDLLAAAAALRPTTKEWFSAARNHALYANQGGLYDPILEHLKLR